ncbi:hypothetical protein HPB52_009743 [Rhipicephalus sanguineus]|uniref:Chitinase n=1 Tax=Rhipicephalus sanguineus TaxID=34632 RepID=A0A9D4PG63_RHISA|nr:hypothetical protein HPB52_009743 [Rhipicephalus sanguineus]
MDKEATTKRKLAKPPQEGPSGKERAQMPTPGALTSSRHYRGGRPGVVAVSTKREPSARQKRRELSQSSKHAQQSLEPLAEATVRASVTLDNDGNTSTPLSPLSLYKYSRCSAGQADTPPAPPFPSAPHSGVHGPLKSPEPGSDRVTAVTAAVGAQSPQWFTPPDTRSLSPELTGSPPKIRVLVSPTAGSSKAQPYDGFPGVRTYIGAPEVIVFTPRGSPSGAATPLPSPDAGLDRGRQKTAAELPSPVEGAGIDEAALINGRRCPTLLQAWAICVVAAATLNLPVGLFILTYFSTDHGFRPTTLPTTGRSTVSFSEFTSSSVITQDPFPGVPASCIRPIPMNNPNVSLPSTSYTPTRFRRTQHQIFCVFNVSRLGRASSMTPMDMPLDYCSSIVYWSLGVVASGAVESRVDKFDNTNVGLYKWRDMLDLLGFHDTKIMLAVGGYPQESVFFSRLGRDSGAMARFVASLMKMVLKSSANGILIDWVEPEPGCGRPEDWTTLLRLVDSIRRAYRLSGTVVGSGDIAVAIPQNDRVAKQVMGSGGPPRRMGFLTDAPPGA